MQRSASTRVFCGILTSSWLCGAGQARRLRSPLPLTNARGRPPSSAASQARAGPPHKAVATMKHESLRTGSSSAFLLVVGDVQRIWARRAPRATYFLLLVRVRQEPSQNKTEMGADDEAQREHDHGCTLRARSILL